MGEGGGDKIGGKGGVNFENLYFQLKLFAEGFRLAYKKATAYH